jgi:enoyl-CoA hydratase
MSELILYNVDDGVATLTINRPKKKNAMTFAMLGEFTERVNAVGDDPDVRVLVITGAPGSFCAGTDLADLASIPGEKRGLRGTAEETDRWWPIVECPVPVIGAIDGPAFGMGAEFSTQCDVRIASPQARFSWNFAQRGLVPDTGAGSWLLPRLIGPSNALRLLYTADVLSADDAKALGFVHQVVPPEDVVNVATQMARDIAKNSPFSHRRMKAMVYAGLSGDIGDHMQRHTTAMAECFASNDHREGVASFLERREANFTGT